MRQTEMVTDFMHEIYSPAIVEGGCTGEILLWNRLEDHRLCSIAEIVEGDTAKKTIRVIIGRRIREDRYFVICIAAEKLKKVIAEIEIHVSKKLVPRKAIAVTIRIEV